MRPWCSDTGLCLYALTQRQMVKKKESMQLSSLRITALRLNVGLNNFQPIFLLFLIFFQIVLTPCIAVCACRYVAGQYTLFLSLIAVLKFLNWRIITSRKWVLYLMPLVTTSRWIITPPWYNGSLRASEYFHHIMLEDRTACVCRVFSCLVGFASLVSFGPQGPGRRHKAISAHEVSALLPRLPLGKRGRLLGQGPAWTSIYYTANVGSEWKNYLSAPGDAYCIGVQSSCSREWELNIPSRSLLGHFPEKSQRFSVLVLYIYIHTYTFSVLLKFGSPPYPRILSHSTCSESICCFLNLPCLYFLVGVLSARDSLDLLACVQHHKILRKEHIISL